MDCIGTRIILRYDAIMLLYLIMMLLLYNPLVCLCGSICLHSFVVCLLGYCH